MHCPFCGGECPASTERCPVCGACRWKTDDDGRVVAACPDVAGLLSWAALMLGALPWISYALLLMPPHLGAGPLAIAWMTPYVSGAALAVAASALICCVFSEQRLRALLRIIAAVLLALPPFVWIVTQDWQHWI